MTCEPVFKSLFCFSLLTPVGGGIPHGVFPEMGPGGNMGQLTEHRPLWTGTHETVQSLPDTMQTCNNKAQADTEARGGCRAASSGLTVPDPVERKTKGGKRGSVSWAPDLDKDMLSEFVSDSLADVVAHLEPGTTEVQDQAGETASESEVGQARKFSVDASANRDAARPRRESTGEHWSQIQV